MPVPDDDLYRLPDPERLLPGESLASLVTRNAENYRFNNPMQILSRIDPPATALTTLVALDWSAEFHTKLAALLGLDEQELNSLRYGLPDKMALRLFGVSLHRDFVAPARKQLCPICLREGGYHRMLWDLSILTVCPVHSIRLITRCPDADCKRPLTWRRGRVTHCSNPDCNHDLRTAHPVTVEERSLGSIRKLIGYLDGSLQIDIGPPGLDIETCLKLALQLGAFSNGLERVGRPGSMFEHHADLLHETLDTGWHALADWPRGFHGLLDGLRTRAVGRRGRYGLRKEFGYLSFWLSRMSGEPWCRPVAEAFADYIATQDDFASTAKGLARYGSADALRNRHITMNEAARYLDVAVQTMLSLAEREDLFLVRPSGAGAPSLLRADKVRQLRELKNTTLLKGEAEQRLGVARKVFRSLEDAGLISGRSAGSRVTRQRQYAAEDIDELIRRLESRMPGRESPRPSKLVTITRLHNTADICHAILDGRMSVAGVNSQATGLQRILVAKDAVQTALPRPRSTLSVVQAAKILNVSTETARLWIDRGFLKALRLEDNSAERGLRVTLSSIAEFRQEFGTAAVISAEIGGKSGRWLTHRLAFLGVKPVSGPLIDKGMGSLFRRTDIPSAALAKVETPPKPPRTDGSTKAAFDMAASIGMAAAEVLGHRLKRGWNDFSSAEHGIYLQVLTGKRLTMTGPYTFRLNNRKVGKLREAEQGLVAFGFPDLPFFLIVPWAEVAVLIDAEKADRHGIGIRVDALGNPDRFFNHRHILPNGAGLSAPPER